MPFRQRCRITDGIDCKSKSRLGVVLLALRLPLSLPPLPPSTRRASPQQAARGLFARVVAQRAHVPVECDRHIDAYTGLSARDAIPCQRAQLPAFMERLVDKYRELRWDSDLSDAFVSSGFMGSDEIWKGSFRDQDTVERCGLYFPGSS